MSSAEKIKKIYKTRGMRVPPDITQAAQQGTIIGDEQAFDRFAGELGFVNRDAMLGRTKGIKYFETKQLNGTFEPFGRACRILRKYWDDTSSEEWSQAMPDKKHSLAATTLYFLEENRSTNEKRPPLRPSQKALCNMLAGLYILDKKQPENKQVLQVKDNDSIEVKKGKENLEFLAWAMEKNDPHFTLTGGLKVRVERAMNAVIMAAREVNPEFNQSFSKAL